MIVRVTIDHSRLSAQKAGEEGVGLTHTGGRNDQNYYGINVGDSVVLDHVS